MSNSDCLLQRDGDEYRADAMYLLDESLAISSKLGAVLDGAGAFPPGDTEVRWAAVL